MTHTVIRQCWNEHERGWGVKSWSTTLHLSTEDRDQFIAAYWASMPDAVQDWYIAPEQRYHSVEISNELYQELVTQSTALTGNDFGGKGLWHSGATKRVIIE